jgi:hypothetical protein
MLITIAVLTLGRRILNAPPHYLKQVFPSKTIRSLTQQAARAYAVAI